MTDSPDFAGACAAKGVPLWRVEDGFLRSVGLGSDLLAPGSLVLDDQGLYYDARSPSRLENILQETEFTAALIDRARLLRERIVAQALTKYNLGGPPADLREQAGGRPVLLVVEQVPSDAALRFGGGDVEGNLGLLESVRRENPGAFIAYKEHPDLVARNRRGRLSASVLLHLADVIVSTGDMQRLYEQVDELHCSSSLAGFEALLRGVRVCVWGRPFYAGWNLTQDRQVMPRRSRVLGLDELVAGALLLYPRYADPLTGVPCSAEDFLDAIAILRQMSASSSRIPVWQRQLQRLFRKFS